MSWRPTTLGNEIELAYGKPMPAHDREAGPYAVYGSNGRVGTHKEALVAGPGIVIGRKGSIGEVVFSHQPFWPIDTTYFVRMRVQNDWRFTFYLLKWKKLNLIDRPSPVPGLNREDVYSIEAELPEIKEQQDIAKVLDSLQAGIELELDALCVAQDLKRAAMRALFTKGLRGEAQKDTEIGPVPESWDVVDFAEVREWLQYGTSTHCTYEATPYLVLRIPNIEPGYVKPDDLKYAKLSKAEAERYVLQDGDLIFIRTNGVIERLGACAVYAGQPEGALFASYLIRARLKLDQVEPRFVAYFYASDLGTSIVAGRATPPADGKYNLNTGTIDSLPLPLPPTLDEQREIVAVLDAIDRKIDLHKRKRAVLDELFKALLHKLMTGEIRVADLDLSAIDAAQPEGAAA